MSETRKYDISKDPVHVRRRRIAGAITVLIATGAFWAAGGAGKAESIIKNANAPHGRAIPEHPVTVKDAHVEGDRMVVMQGGNAENDAPMTEITYHQGKDHTVYGFAAKHLKGDPRQYLELLRGQLDKEDQANYNAPDGLVFNVPSEDVAEMNSTEIGTAATYTEK